MPVHRKNQYNPAMLPRHRDNSEDLPESPHRLRFRGFEFDYETPELWQGSKRIELPLQPLKVLALLAKRHGQVVSSDEIAAAVWGKRVVSWPDSLHVCIRQLRRALGESANNPGIIQTVPRRGYRFMAEVEPVELRSEKTKRIALLVPAIVLALGLAFGAGKYFFSDVTSPDVQSPVFEAYEAYEKGAYLLSQFPRGDLQLAASLFSDAVAADPQYVAAWAGLADTYIRLQEFDAAQPAIERALELDPQSPEVLRVVGDLFLFRDWSVDKAKANYLQAIHEDTDSAKGHQHLAMTLAISGQMDQAIEHMERALTIEPVSTIIHADLGWFYYLGGQYDKSITQCRSALDIEPSLYFPHFCLLDTYIKQGKKANALEEAQIILKAWGGTPIVLASSTDEALDLFWTKYLGLLNEHEQKDQVSPMNFAHAYAGLQDTAMTLHWLRIAYDERDPGALFVAVNPSFDFLRNHSEFEALIQRHNFLQSTANNVADGKAFRIQTHTSV